MSIEITREWINYSEADLNLLFIDVIRSWGDDQITMTSRGILITALNRYYKFHRKAYRLVDFLNDFTDGDGNLDERKFIAALKVHKNMVGRITNILANKREIVIKPENKFDTIIIRNFTNEELATDIREVIRTWGTGISDKIRTQLLNALVNHTNTSGETFTLALFVKHWLINGNQLNQAKLSEIHNVGKGLIKTLADILNFQDTPETVQSYTREGLINVLSGKLGFIHRSLLDAAARDLEEYIAILLEYERARVKQEIIDSLLANK